MGRVGTIPIKMQQMTFPDEKAHFLGKGGSGDANQDADSVISWGIGRSGDNTIKVSVPRCHAVMQCMDPHKEHGGNVMWQCPNN